MAEDIAVWSRAGGAGGLVRAGRRLLVLIGRWRARPPRQLRLCESLGLGERRFVAVVECGPQRFLIGGAGNSVALLTQLPPNANPEPATETGDDCQ